ncbi:MAG: hypothetical protein M0R39_13710 [Prolixibacteraceae bacterium]|nr:hypothetical protein [Prolixibacteraceae bacterium]
MTCPWAKSKSNVNGGDRVPERSRGALTGRWKDSGDWDEGTEIFGIFGKHDYIKLIFVNQS